MAAQPSENELDFPFNSNREFELKLGSSFHSKGGSKTAFHTIRCEFDFLLYELNLEDSQQDASQLLK